MGERPISFTGPMVRAILDGKKTQTRRVLKPQPPQPEDFPRSPFSLSRSVADGIKMYFQDDYERLPKHPTKYDLIGSVGVVRDAGYPTKYKVQFAVGDLLWVKETWAETSVAPIVETIDRPWVVYRAADSRTDYGGPWRSSRFMPRRASRITLRVTDVRVQRVQDISEEDAKAEGIRPLRDGSGTFVGREGPRNLVTPWNTAREAFADVWDSINKGRGFDWDANPWVAAYSFEVVR